MRDLEVEMPCDILDEYAISSLRREVERSLGQISKCGEELDWPFADTGRANVTSI